MPPWCSTLIKRVYLCSCRIQPPVTWPSNGQFAQLTFINYLSSSTTTCVLFPVWWQHHVAKNEVKLCCGLRLSVTSRNHFTILGKTRTTCARRVATLYCVVCDSWQGQEKSASRTAKTARNNWRNLWNQASCCYLLLSRGVFKDIAGLNIINDIMSSLVL